jgi:PIN domain nuclease of toxin-antitoxin system
MTRLLLDTHALLWWWSGDASLSSGARTAIADADATVYVSAASAWEIATKARVGGLKGCGEVVARFGELAAAADLRHLAVAHSHGLRAGSYQAAHRDPFDRMLAAQAELESLTLVTNDSAFGEFPVLVLW